ncbi:hypothetical protein Pr1d_09520 [Bythopirellula goksoeyrii]|uniref:Uncharacterized protein n=1 Tax=Bythopirellula goksoeyrii TaxID=1400387 RepID=A0A5B9Q3S3_9BACT|nr:hypothetical protein Pr1d_09520 [Bythopirellula goksoeyrii]
MFRPGEIDNKTISVAVANIYCLVPCRVFQIQTLAETLRKFLAARFVRIAAARAFAAPIFEN